MLHSFLGAPQLWSVQNTRRGFNGCKYHITLGSPPRPGICVRHFPSVINKKKRLANPRCLSSRNLSPCTTGRDRASEIAPNFSDDELGPLQGGPSIVIPSAARNNMFSLEERFEILKTYFQSQCCVAETVRILKRNMGRDRAPTEGAIRKLWGVLLSVLPYIDVAATTWTSKKVGDEPRSWSACSSAVLLRRQPINNEMDTGNDDKRLGFGTQDRLTGGVVPAPGMSSSSDGLTAGLPTGPAVESATVRMEVVEEVVGAEEPALSGLKERAEPGAVSQSPLPQRRKELRLILDRTEVDVLAGASAEDSVASGSASPDGVLRRKRERPRKKRYPKEMRIRVVAGEIVNSPVADSGSAGTPAPGGAGMNRDTGVVDFTLLASSDAGRVVDRAGPRSDSASLGSTPVEDAGDLSSSFEQIPYKGKKRGRKLKGSNAPGSHALTKISSKRLDLEDDEWDREDFFKVSKKGSPGMKKRKGLVECGLDDRLSSSQKTAVEEVTGLFPQMSPKSVVAETLRVLDIAGEAERKTVSMNGALRRQIKVGVNVAKIAVQRLVADITKCSGPSDEARANNLALEREVIKLRREMDILRREKISLRDQVESLRLTVQSLRDRDRGRDRSPSSEGTVPGRDSSVSRRSRDRGRRSLRRRDYVADKETRENRDLPPAYRPPLGGVRMRLEDVAPRLHKAGRVGQMNSSRVASDARRDSRVDNVSARGADEVRPKGAVCAEPSLPSLTYPANGEPWTVVGSKRARKRRKRKGKKDAMVGRPADSGVVPPPSTGVSDTCRVAAGGVVKTTRGSYAAVAGGVPESGKGTGISRPTRVLKGIPRRGRSLSSSEDRGGSSEVLGDGGQCCTVVRGSGDSRRGIALVRRNACPLTAGDRLRRIERTRTHSRT
ncbi:hypothetical protein G5I_00415 [Acromyrmex echinatior]|uniref:DUF4817 domain-containing protein n=1 Tax=Acromyrmex echinatior TaxID=103372 RepID=F4W4U0_ACREC|nr:hypothetical protein G5I_00415 [Acromyrmex echinatior]